MLRLHEGVVAVEYTQQGRPREEHGKGEGASETWGEGLESVGAARSGMASQGRVVTRLDRQRPRGCLSRNWHYQALSAEAAPRPSIAGRGCATSRRFVLWRGKTEVGGGAGWWVACVGVVVGSVAFSAKIAALGWGDLTGEDARKGEVVAVLAWVQPGG